MLQSVPYFLTDIAVRTHILTIKQVSYCCGIINLVTREE